MHPATAGGADPQATRAWILAEPKAGMFHQALALAGALGLHVATPTVRRRWYLDCLPQSLFASRLVLAAHGLREPWPDLVIGSGRYGGRLSAALKRLHPRLRNVQIQDPRTARHCFDVIVTPVHDRLRGPNVIHTVGALHALSRARLAPAAAAWAARLDGPGPLLAVLLGGPTRRAPFHTAQFDTLCDELLVLAGAGGWRVGLCASRRTPVHLRAQLAARLAGRLQLLWLGEGENPYRGLLALADAFLVSADSVNMASEALASGRPVHRWGGTTPGSRIARFHQSLEAQGLVRPWRGQPEYWAYPALDELPGVAEVIAGRLGLPRPPGLAPPSSAAPPLPDADR